MPASLRVFALFTLAYFLSYFFRSANAVIAPDLTRELGLDAATLGLMTSLFYLAFAAVQLPLGAGLDRWGPRWVTPALMFVGAAGSWVFASAHTTLGLMAGRVLLGVGMAGILMGAYKAFSRWFPKRRFATVAGWLVGLGSAGALASGTPLAWLAGVLGWRQVFFWGGWVILASALAILLGVRNTPGGDRLEPAPAEGGLARVLSSPVFWSMAGMNLFVVGTFLGARLSVGQLEEAAGRLGEAAYDDLFEDLKRRGFAFLPAEQRAAPYKGAPGYRVRFYRFADGEWEPGSFRLPRLGGLYAVGACVSGGTSYRDESESGARLGEALLRELEHPPGEGA